MPLKPGKSEAAISANIAHLRKKGYKRSQAIAIALREAGVSRKRARKWRGKG